MHSYETTNGSGFPVRNNNNYQLIVCFARCRPPISTNLERKRKSRSHTHRTGRKILLVPAITHNQTLFVTNGKV